MPARTPTLDEVAAAAGVSRMSASRALRGRPGVSEELRHRIQSLAVELGYVPNRAAQRLAGARRVIGMICLDLQGAFVAAFVGGALHAARAGGYKLLIYALADPDEEVGEDLASLLAQSTQGVICSVPNRRDSMAALSAAGVPVVALEMPGNLGPSLSGDNYNGASAAVRHLLDLGHRRIAHVAGPPDLLSAQERRRAFEDGLREHGLPADRLVAQGDNTEAGGFAAAQRLLALPAPPTAILASNDAAALGAMEAVREAGLRVPADVSVIGFDDLPPASLAHPPLTTVRQPVEQMGQSAVNTLLAMLAGVQPVSQVITFPTQLVVRGSTAPAPRRTAPAAQRRRPRRR